MYRHFRRDQWTVTRKVAAASFFAQLYFYVPVLTLYWQARGLTLFQIAALQSLLVGAQFLLEVPTGIVADRFGRRWSFRLALVAQLLGEIVFLLARDYPLFIAAQLLAGLGFALASGSVEALVYDSLSPGDRARAMQRASGLIGAAVRAAGVLAFVTGGLFLAEFTVERTMSAVGLTAFAVAVALGVSLTVAEPRAASGHERQRAAAPLGDEVFRVLPPANAMPDIGVDPGEVAVVELREGRGIAARPLHPEPVVLRRHRRTAIPPPRVRRVLRRPRGITRQCAKYCTTET